MAPALCKSLIGLNISKKFHENTLNSLNVIERTETVIYKVQRSVTKKDT